MLSNEIPSMIQQISSLKRTEHAVACLIFQLSILAQEKLFMGNKTPNSNHKQSV